MRLTKTIFAAILGLAMLAAPASAIQLWSQQIGDVNFPGLTAGQAVISTPGTSQKIASGQATFTGTGTATTGLTSVAACALSISTGSAPGVSTSTATYTASGGTLSLFTWMPTSNANPTLIASTASAVVGWVCTGS